uniref:LRRcap domain-containing protein n=1 Tax=Rhabditophanes sp. KR3021 TaxID=114890 RepID=A0AC35U2I2_9BILA
MSDIPAEETKAQTMLEKIEVEMRGQTKDKILDLHLDNCIGEKIEGIDEGFVSIEMISIINSQLKSAQNLPSLPTLKILDLSVNQIEGNLKAITVCSNLHHINLSSNPIKNIEDLADLKDLQHLVSLDLYCCPVTLVEDYRDKVFELLPQLNFLDAIDREGNEMADDMEGEGEDSGGWPEIHVLESSDEEGEAAGEEETPATETAPSARKGTKRKHTGEDTD